MASKSSMNEKLFFPPVAFSDASSFPTAQQLEPTVNGHNQGNPPDQSKSNKKVSIIGCGQVGLAIAYAILNQEIASTIALVDIAASRLEGEAMDLQQGSAFHSRVQIIASSSYDAIKDSHLVIVTAGSPRKPGESRLALLGRNVKIMTSVMTSVMKQCPAAAVCIVANPCDIMTAVAAKLAGKIAGVPPGRVFGSGTLLDSGRMKNLIATRLEIDAQSVHGYVIGEHGDSSVPVWSSINVAGIPLLGAGETASDIHDEIHKEVIQTAADVIKKKGYTNWAIGLAVADIAHAVLNDSCSIKPVSTCVRGYMGTKEDVFLSLPCVLGAQGVVKVANLPLTDSESKLFCKSVESIWEAQSGIWNDI